MSSFSAGEDGPSKPEWVVMGLSITVTVLLFGFVAWHAVNVPAGVAPEATVTDTVTIADGRVAATVEVYNPAARGLQSVTVSADCAADSVTFTHVPTDARRTGVVVCPAGTTDPSASVHSWIRSD